MAYEERYERRERRSTSTARDRSRRKKGRLPKPVVRIGTFLIAFIVLLLIIIFAARACARSGEAGAYREYIAEVGNIVAASDDIGARLEQLLLNPGDINRANIQTTLDGFVTQCEGLRDQASTMNVPNGLQDDENGAHQILVAVLDYRYKGVSQIKTHLLSALEIEDLTGTDVTASGNGESTSTTIPLSASTAGYVQQIGNSLLLLVTSDILYRETYEAKVSKYLADKQFAGTEAPSSQFISDPEMASSAQVNQILTAMRKTSNLQAVRGVALTSVLVQPDNVEIRQGSTYNLTQSQGLAFIVTVENQGNVDEQQVPVKVTLTSESSQQSPVTSLVPLIVAKETASVTIDGLNATTYGEIATLVVEVGPVQDERYYDNNTLTAFIIFKL